MIDILEIKLVRFKQIDASIYLKFLNHVSL